MNDFKRYLSIVAVLITLALASYSCSDGGGAGPDPTNNGPAPAINNIQPDSGNVGSTVTISGENFSSQSKENQVRFKNVDADVVSASETSLNVTVPDGATTGPVQVTVNGKSSREVNFVVTTDTEGTDYNYHSDYTYNVNVVYFVPNDLEPKENWHSRLSAFLIYYQGYYEKWMEHWGFGSKTFGLLKDQGMVKITKVTGSHEVEYYDNNVDKANEIRTEVTDYFKAHPNNNAQSKSWIVYIPRPVPHPQGGLPYFTVGRWAYVEDHEQDPSNLENSGGGDAHELGHALGLQHNAEPLPERDELGNALMHNGNHVWNGKSNSYHNHGMGSDHTSLTQADAEILDVSQTFSKQDGSFYAPTNDHLEEATGTHEDGNIIISGEYTTDVPVTSAIVVLNPPGQEGYNRYAFPTTPTQPGKFKVSISKDRLILHDDQDYGVLLWLVHENGHRTGIDLPGFSFQNGVPMVDFHIGAVSTISKSGWQVIDYSDQANTTGKVATNIIDDDFGTWWHNDFTADNVTPTHYLTVDMGEAHDVSGFQFVQVPASHKNSRVKKLEIQVKNNEDSDWESLGDFMLNDSKTPQQINLNDTQNFRYFKLITKVAYGGPDFKAASLAEVGVYEN